MYDPEVLDRKAKEKQLQSSSKSSSTSKSSTASKSSSASSNTQASNDDDEPSTKASANVAVPTSYQSFLSFVGIQGPIPKPFPTPKAENFPSPPSKIPSLSCLPSISSSSSPSSSSSSSSLSSSDPYRIPTLSELGYNPTDVTTPFKGQGGETLALQRLQHHLQRTQWIKNFEKPNTSPTSLEPDTTGLSPYLKFGCLGSRTFYWGLQNVYSTGGTYSKPPVSLEGQLLWREFFYCQGFAIPHFDTMKNNPICRPIPWEYNETYIQAWENGATGYPWIDAAIQQLKSEGWLHHLARHAIACFLTRGDLYQNWEVGAKIFDKYLLDSDWAINNGNWMWLSASAYFYQFFRVYSPVAFPKKTDPNGDYVRKYLPLFKNFPKEYIYEPWKAPLSIQQKYGVIVGDTYPNRIVDHDIVSKANISKHAQAYKQYTALSPEQLAQSMQSVVSGMGQTQVGSDPRLADTVLPLYGHIGNSKKSNAASSSSSTSTTTNRTKPKDIASLLASSSSSNTGGSSNVTDKGTSSSSNSSSSSSTPAQTKHDNSKKSMKSNGSSTIVVDSENAFVIDLTGTEDLSSSSAVVQKVLSKKRSISNEDTSNASNSTEVERSITATTNSGTSSSHSTVDTKKKSKKDVKESITVVEDATNVTNKKQLSLKDMIDTKKKEKK